MIVLVFLIVVYWYLWNAKLDVCVFMQIRFTDGVAPLCVLISGLMLERNSGSESMSIHFVQVHSQRAWVNFKVISIINIWFSYPEVFKSIRMQSVSLTPQNTMSEATDSCTKCNHFLALI